MRLSIIILISIFIIGVVVILCLVVLAMWLAFYTRIESPHTTVVKQKCEEYAKLACSYSTPSNDSLFDDLFRIKRGIKAARGEFPHMVFIIMGSPDEDRHKICGATLISEYFALTAAHCVHGFQRGDVRYTLGDVDYDVIDDTNMDEVVEIIIHKRYDSHIFNYEGNAYDIALLRLAKKVEFGWNKRPICLNTNFYSIGAAHEEQLTTCGWRTDEIENQKITSLYVLDQYLNTNDRSLADCKYEMRRSHNIICATNPNLDESACPSGSGGPLQIPLMKNDKCPNTYEQVGIVHAVAPICTSWSTGWRGRQLGLYTRVDAYIDWIVPKVWPELYKQLSPQNYGFSISI